MEEYTHKFTGYGRVPSSCVVKINNINNVHHICFIDMGNGTSVTNASEQLASEIVNKFRFMPKECRFYETYYEQDYNNNFDNIDYVWELKGTKWMASMPQWRPSDMWYVDLFIEE